MPDKFVDRARDEERALRTPSRSFSGDKIAGGCLAEHERHLELFAASLEGADLGDRGQDGITDDGEGVRFREQFTLDPSRSPKVQARASALRFVDP